MEYTFTEDVVQDYRNADDVVQEYKNADEDERKHPNIYVSKEPIPEEDTLRYKITRFPNGMDENFIAFILREILQGFSYLHVRWSIDHNRVDSSKIYVCTDQVPMYVKLIFDPDKNISPLGPQGRVGNRDGIWNLGLLALGMAYGSFLPVDSKRNNENLDSTQIMIDNLIKIVNLKMEILDGKQNAQEEDEEGNKKVQMIELPELKKLLEPDFVEELLTKIKKEEKYECEGERERKLSRDFLKMVMNMLFIDNRKQRLPTPNEILAHSFFEQTIDLKKFETSMTNKETQ